MCHGAPGVGKTLSARHYSSWETVSPIVENFRFYETVAPEPALAVFYTPKVHNTPRVVDKEVRSLHTRLSWAIETTLRPDRGSEHLVEPDGPYTEMVIVDEASDGNLAQRGPRVAGRLGGDYGASLLEGAQRRRAGPLAALDGFVRFGELVLELLLTTQEIVAGHPDAVETQFGDVRRAAAQLVEFADQFQAGCAARRDEQPLHLVTVDQPVAAVAPGAGSQIPYVAANRS